MTRMPMGLFAVIAAFLLCANPTLAQDNEEAVEKQPPCSAPECRQFDFWLGHWTVTANGQVVGSNKISAILGGCVLLEEYESAKGYTGKSFNRYDPNTKKWHQLWLDNQGGVLDIAGTYEDGKMVMEGESVAGGEAVLNRITWHNNTSDGTVRQVWDVSKDGGKTWQTVFDGLYNKDE